MLTCDSKGGDYLQDITDAGEDGDEDENGEIISFEKTCDEKDDVVEK